MLGGDREGYALFTIKKCTSTLLNVLGHGLLEHNLQGALRLSISNLRWVLRRATDSDPECLETNL